MRRFVFVVVGCLAFSGVAWAEEDVYATAETTSTRFPDATTAGPVFQKDTRLEVLVREGDRLRVHAGDAYGWIPASAVTTVAPAMPAFDEAQLQKMLQGLGR